MSDWAASAPDPWGAEKNDETPRKAAGKAKPWAELTPASDGLVSVSRFQWESTVRSVVFSNRITKEVAFVLATYADTDGTNVRPSERTIAAALSYGDKLLTERAIRKGTAELMATLFLRQERRGSQSGRRNAASVYSLTVPPWAWQLRATDGWDDRDEDERGGEGARQAPMYRPDGSRFEAEHRNQGSGGSTGTSVPMVPNHRNSCAEDRNHGSGAPATTGTAVHNHRNHRSAYQPIDQPTTTDHPINQDAAPASEHAVTAGTGSGLVADDDLHSGQQDTSPDGSAAGPAPAADVPTDVSAELATDHAMTDPEMQRRVWGQLIAEHGTTAAALAALRVPPAPRPERPEPEPDPSDNIHVPF